MSKPILINVLPTDYYDDCHIEGSINIPLEDLAQRIKQYDKDDYIVLYCARYSCSASRNAWHKVHDMGYTNVWAYEGGIAEWAQAGLPVEGTCKKPYLKIEEERPLKKSDPNVREISLEELKEKLGY